MNQKNIPEILAFYGLKATPRTGWVNRGITNAESVADHSWGAALLCLLHADEAGVDRAAAVYMALIHDLAEAVVGDIVVNSENPQMVSSRKARLEREAMQRLIPDVGDRLRTLWDEHDQQASAVARFVRDMDLVDMCLQALIYRREGTPAETLAEFFSSAAARVTTDTGKRLLAATRAAFDNGTTDA